VGCLLYCTCWCFLPHCALCVWWKHLLFASEQILFFALFLHIACSTVHKRHHMCIACEYVYYSCILTCLDNFLYECRFTLYFYSLHVSAPARYNAAMHFYSSACLLCSTIYSMFFFLYSRRFCLCPTAHNTPFLFETFLYCYTLCAYFSNMFILSAHHFPGLRCVSLLSLIIDVLFTLCLRYKRILTDPVNESSPPPLLLNLRH